MPAVGTANKIASQKIRSEENCRDFFSQSRDLSGILLTIREFLPPWTGRCTPQMSGARWRWYVVLVWLTKDQGRQTLRSAGEEGGHYRHTTGTGITADNPDQEFSARTKERQTLLYCLRVGSGTLLRGV